MDEAEKRSVVSFSASSSQLEAALLNPMEMREADRLAVEAGVSSLYLMEAAGFSVAREVVRLCGRKKRVVVLCGPGNNGGDGFVAARMLTRRGWPVRVALSCKSDALKGDAAINAQRWKGPVEQLSSHSVDGAAMVVDALFGAGLDRPLDGDAAAVVAKINKDSIPCLAVDIPSGINGHDGSLDGPAPVCVATVAFFRPKPGHVLYPGRDYIGRLTVADIGIPALVLERVSPRTFVNDPRLWSLPVLNWRDHKYSRGHVIVFSGVHMSGAARLAAMAARRAGAGLVTVVAPRDTAFLCALDPGLIVVPQDDNDGFLTLPQNICANAVVIGPGLGRVPLLPEMIRDIVSRRLAIVLDADAINTFAGRVDELRAIVRTAAAPIVMTPHEGEFGRLFPEMGTLPRLVKARQAARDLGVFMVLKGADTIIAAPDGMAAVTTHAVPWLATAGSGDVLAGIIAANLAGGMDGFSAACAGVWLHAEAGRHLGKGMVAEDISLALPHILAQLT
ncbi:NAD(P)H-hydrate dehydratase [Haematospirillum sp. 15-248]|uniref:NAD(P)H-hydrate dehydratase n=1 Tax=Haematospirillum sp. 15-248 TaxID=2723107 RepID=UPI001438EC2C|nr:NAD(P)H-hydrate dehydratase [Haematospirillum sp. 15-248]NKD87065.1 NAD(P)H-hydrate dehydratase [Haematospirillum sp. 15-248]